MVNQLSLQRGFLQRSEDNVSTQGPKHRESVGSVHPRGAILRSCRVHEIWGPEPVSTAARSFREFSRQKPRNQNSWVGYTSLLCDRCQLIHLAVVFVMYFNNRYCGPFRRYLKGSVWNVDTYLHTAENALYKVSWYIFAYCWKAPLKVLIHTCVLVKRYYIKYLDTWMHAYVHKVKVMLHTIARDS